VKLDLKSEMDRNKAQFYLDKLITKKAKIELKEVKKAVSVDQFAYLHICLGYFALHTGYSITEAKDIFAGLLPELFYYKKNEYQFRRSTTSFDSKECTALIDYVRAFCNDNLGVYVPTSEEYLVSKFEIERELESVK
jgi:hypothetical protein